MNTVEAFERVAFAIAIILVVEAILMIIYGIRTKGNTKVETLLEVESNVKVELVDTATLLRMEVSIGFIGQVWYIRIGVILTIVYLVYQPSLVANSAQPSGIVISVNIGRAVVELLAILIQPCLVVAGLLRHVASLRNVHTIEHTHHSLHAHVAIERLGFVVVETKVYIAQGGYTAHFVRDYQSHIIQAKAILVVCEIIAQVVAFCTSNGVSQRQCGIVATIYLF